jgi:ribose-phosphate pyrophosphokinase
MERTTLVVSTAAYDDMARAVCAAAEPGSGLVPGQVERRHFPDGERYLRLLCSVEGQDAALIGGTISDEDTLELYDLACCLVEGGVHRLTIVIPYFGYSTMERAVHPGEAVTAKIRARLISSIPVAASGSRALLVDLHAEGITQYFEGPLRPFHVEARPVTVELIRRLGGAGDDFVIACTDAGRAKWVESLANEIGVPASFVLKRRRSGSETEITAVSAQVEGRRVVIYDDMIRTGGSLVGAARAYRDAGAAEICAVATHGPLPGDSLERIRRSGLLARLACTDSHPRAPRLAGDFLEVASIAPLLAARLAR